MTREEERKEIVQDVIDRLIYLSPTEFEQYKTQLAKVNRSFGLNVRKVNGTRVYNNQNKH